MTAPQMVHRVRVVGMPDNGCAQAIGHVGAISRLGVGHYRLRVEGPVATADLAARAKRFLWVSLGDLTADHIDVNVWGGDDKPTDLQPDEEILVGYARRVKPYAPGEKMTDRHPATPEKLSGAVICTTPGYNGVFHIEPDPPDLAERRAARVAEHQRREMQERAARGAVHAAATRPDGFDQHQVDAAKAALLASAPPRYPRRAR